MRVTVKAGTGCPTLRSRRSLAARGAIVRLTALMATAAACLVWGAPAALANGGVAMAVNVTNSQQTVKGQGGGGCTWEVTSDVDLVNLTSQQVTVNSVSYSVSWKGPGSKSGVQSAITVVSDAGLVPGVTLAPGERRSFSPLVVQFSIPCGADFGDLAVLVSSPQGTGSGDAPFLSGGTTVPPVGAGTVVLAAGIGGSLLVVERRRRHRPASPAGI